MKRSIKIVCGCRLLLIGLLIACGCAQAEPLPEHTYRLLILDSQSGPPYSEIRTHFLAALERFGYRAGENLQLIRYSAGNDIEKGVALLRAEQDNSFDVVYAGGTCATIAAKQVYWGSGQPVVFAGTTDPVGIGVIDEKGSPPKANFTGVAFPVPIEARLRFIRHLMPDARRFGFIYADMPQSHSYIAWIEHELAVDPLFDDMEFVYRSVPLIKGDEGDREMTLEAKQLVVELNDQVDAFIAPNDQLGARQPYYKMLSEEARKPVIGLMSSDVQEDWGAMATIYPLHENIGRMAAEMVRALLEGQPVSALPARWPDQFGYAVNLKRAKAGGINVPIGILQLAGRHIVK